MRAGRHRPSKVAPTGVQRRSPEALNGVPHPRAARGRRRGPDPPSRQRQAARARRAACCCTPTRPSRSTGSSTSSGASRRRRRRPRSSATRLPAADEELGDRLVTRPPGYLLRVEPASSTPSASSRRSSDGDLDELTDALALWRGPPLSQLAYEPFAQTEIARLEELRLAAVEARIEASSRAAGTRAAIAELETLVQQHPLRERLYGQLMLALYRSGRQAEALEAYQRARRSLDEQLGIEPGPGSAGARAQDPDPGRVARGRRRSRARARRPPRRRRALALAAAGACCSPRPPQWPRSSSRATPAAAWPRCRRTTSE